MNIHHDYYYAMGKSHLFCQDYVTQGDSPTPFLVLADGCSSSADSDVGARLLCATVKKIIERYLPLYQENDTPDWSLLPNYKAFGQMVITEAQSAAALLALPLETLDASLLIAFISNDTAHVYVYGDGCIVLKTHDGEVGYVDIGFSHNTPYYLSYWANALRLQAYVQEAPEDALEIKDSLQNLNSKHAFHTPLSFSFSLQQFAAVGIASDGIASFTQADQTRLPIADVATAWLDFKNTQGEFVKRRLPKVLNRYAQDGIMAQDDISLGVFVTAT
jgi:hypothetical protein